MLWAGMQYSGSSVLASGGDRICSRYYLCAGLWAAGRNLLRAVRHPGALHRYFDHLTRSGAIISVSLTPIVATALIAYGNNTLWLLASYILAAGILERDMRRRHAQAVLIEREGQGTWHGGAGPLAFGVLGWLVI